MELNVLDLSNNDLKSLPPEMGLMASLRKLPLDGNPLRTIRRQLVTGWLLSLGPGFGGLLMLNHGVFLFAFHAVLM